MDVVYKYVISPPSALRASASLASPLLRLWQREFFLKIEDVKGVALYSDN